MSEIIIRPAAEKDIPEMLVLLVQVCNVHHRIRPDFFKKDATKYNADELKKILADCSRPIFAAVDRSDRMLGYAFCEIKQRGSSGAAKSFKTLYIDDICVDEEQRGKHIGSSLFEAVKAYAKSIGCYDITLNVWEGNDAAYKFYLAQDMKPLKTEMEIVL